MSDFLVPSWAVKGQPVVCINDDWETWLPIPTRVPMLNEVLTISGVMVRRTSVLMLNRLFLAGVFLYFDEIPARQAALGLDGGVSWSVTAFRPLTRATTDIETDVALFSHLLARQGADA